jgi:hypothetical protein
LRDPSSLKDEVQQVAAALDSTVTLKPELVTDRLAKVLIYPRFRAGYWSASGSALSSSPRLVCTA